MSSRVKTEQLSSITSLLSPGKSAFKRGFKVIRHDFKKMKVQNCHNQGKPGNNVLSIMIVIKIFLA